MGAGVGWLDYDQDGFLDAFFANSGATPHFKPATPPQPALYRSNGDGTFTDMTAKSGLSVGPGHFFFGVAAGDYDNDGYPDLYVSGYRRSLLLPQHRQGRLRGRDGQGRGRRTRAPGPRRRDGSTTTATDGSTCWSPTTCSTTWSTTWCAATPRPSYEPIATPTASPGTSPRLYRNNGDGTFADVTAGRPARQPRRQEPGRGPGRPGRRRLDRHLHRQRHPAELRLLQQGRRDLRGRQLLLGRRLQRRRQGGGGHERRRRATSTATATSTST